MFKYSVKNLLINLILAILLFTAAENINAQLPPPPPPPPPVVPPPPPPPPASISDSIRSTRHNLSISGPGTIKSASEDRICYFCHTPHNAQSNSQYLWNHAKPVDPYIPYQSTTLIANVGQPTGASKLCLGCHDGTVALGALTSEPQEIPFAGGIRFIPEGSTKIGTDLSDDHPVSFVYDNSLAAASGELVFPSVLPVEIKLDANGELQCTACHDPHNNKNGQFLVTQNNYSNLCTSCHDILGWDVSAHALSNATWDGTGTDPWPRTEYSTVAENGCENCHRPHNAGKHERLLNYIFEEDNCLVCHNEHVASTDVSSDLSKLYRHPVQDYTGIHDPTEDFTSSVQDHVECSDCHNPHIADGSASPGAPVVSGPISGVSGISAAGQQINSASFEYEICFKCHADNNVLSVFSVDRQLQQLNTRLEFDPSNPSYHPVESQGKNPNVPSLLPPYSTTSTIFCTDCHNSDSSSSVNGPHGSIHKFLLSDQYVTWDFTMEKATNYALCYKCHDRNNILGDNSFPLHSKHIVDSNTPCSACHDPHGISFTQGNSVNNSHLINFDISIVQPDSLGRLQFEDTGTFSGRCFLKCHLKSHEPETYP